MSADSTERFDFTCAESNESNCIQSELQSDLCRRHITHLKVLVTLLEVCKRIFTKPTLAKLSLLVRPAESFEGLCVNECCLKTGGIQEVRQCECECGTLLDGVVFCTLPGKKHRKVRFMKVSNKGKVEPVIKDSSGLGSGPVRCCAYAERRLAARTFSAHSMARKIQRCLKWTGPLSKHQNVRDLQSLE